MEEEGDRPAEVPAPGFGFGSLVTWGALFVVLGVVLVCAGSNVGVLECRPSSPRRPSAVLPPIARDSQKNPDNPSPGECVLRSTSVLGWGMEWWTLLPSHVKRFEASRFRSAEGEGPVVLVLDDEEKNGGIKENREIRIPLHPPWTVSSVHGASIAKKVNEHFSMFRGSETGFLYNEKPSTLFVAYGLSLIVLGMLLPCLSLCRRTK